MSDLYAIGNGSKYISGEIYQVNGATIKLDLSTSKIIFTIQPTTQQSGSSYNVIRQIISGEFVYDGGRLASGTAKTVTVFAATNTGELFGETASSYNMKAGATFTDPFDPKYYLPQDAESVNYYYASLPNDSIGQGQFTSVPTLHDRSLITGLSDASFAPEGWWSSAFSTSASGTTNSLSGTAKTADLLAFTHAPSFGKGNADRITNFNPKEKDRLQIQLSQFGADAAGTFKVAKNPKALTKALATSTDFVYLKSRGELYYNENGKQPGFGDCGVFAILEGKPNISSTNIGFI